MEKVRCGVCSRLRDLNSCEIVVLTDEEKKAIRASGAEPQDEYHYCRPCWKNLANPVSGPAFMKGIFQIRLRQLGVANAEQLANKYHAGLVSKIKEKPS